MPRQHLSHFLIRCASLPMTNTVRRCCVVARSTNPVQQESVIGWPTFSAWTPAYVERSNLRVLADRFRKELLRERGLAVGRSDGRYTGDDIDDVAEHPEGDPSSYGIGGAYTAGLHEVLRADFGVEFDDRVYRISGGSELGSAWSWRPE